MWSQNGGLTCCHSFKSSAIDVETIVSSDYIYGSATVRPLYYHGESDPTLRDSVSMIDLEHVLGSLFKKAKVGLIKDGPLQYRACLSQLYNCCVRPWEVKHGNTANWMWHGLSLEVLDIKWLEMKTLLIQAMAIIADTHNKSLICIEIKNRPTLQLQYFGNE